MINPSYDPRGCTWGQNVYFGRVSNFDTAFAPFLARNNMKPKPTPHSEQRFREFVIDPDEWESRLRGFHEESDYPVLFATLTKPEYGYSIEMIETLYTFYVIRRLATTNPSLVHLQFKINENRDITSSICAVNKRGYWN
jgi:hypothetical protein